MLSPCPRPSSQKGRGREVPLCPPVRGQRTFFLIYWNRTLTAHKSSTMPRRRGSTNRSSSNSSGKRTEQPTYTCMLGKSLETTVRRDGFSIPSPVPFCFVDTSSLVPPPSVFFESRAGLFCWNAGMCCGPGTSGMFRCVGTS